MVKYNYTAKLNRMSPRAKTHLRRACFDLPRRAA